MKHAKKLYLYLYPWRGFGFQFIPNDGEWYCLIRLGLFGVNVYYEVPRTPYFRRIRWGTR